MSSRMNVKLVVLVGSSILVGDAKILFNNFEKAFFRLASIMPTFRSPSCWVRWAKWSLCTLEVFLDLLCNFRRNRDPYLPDSGLWFWANDDFYCSRFEFHTFCYNFMWSVVLRVYGIFIPATIRKPIQNTRHIQSVPLLFSKHTADLQRIGNGGEHDFLPAPILHRCFHKDLRFPVERHWIFLCCRSDKLSSLVLFYRVPHRCVLFSLQSVLHWNSDNQIFLVDHQSEALCHHD